MITVVLRVFAPYIAGAAALVGVGLYARSKLKSLNPLNAASGALKTAAKPVKDAYKVGKKGVKGAVKGTKTAFRGAKSIGKSGLKGTKSAFRGTKKRAKSFGKSAFKAAKSKNVQKAVTTAALATNPVGVTYLAATRTKTGKKAVKAAKKTAKKTKKKAKRAFRGAKKAFRGVF